MSRPCQQVVTFSGPWFYAGSRGLESHLEDTLRRGGQVIPYRANLNFSLAGVGCALHTNSAALAENIGQLTEWRGAAVCDLHVEVDTGDASPVGPAHFRGMHH